MSNAFVRFTDKWEDPIWLDAGRVEAIYSDDGLTHIVMQSRDEYKVRDSIDTVIKDISAALRRAA